MTGYRDGQLILYCDWCWEWAELPDQESIRSLPAGWKEKSSNLQRAHACPEHARKRTVPNAPREVT